MEKQMYLYFAFVGEDFDPNQIGRRLKLTATESWQKGEKAGRHTAARFSYWKLAIAGDDLALLQVELLQLLADKEADILALKAEYQADTLLKIVLPKASAAPQMVLGSEIIAFLHRSNTTIDAEMQQAQSLAS